MMIGEKVLSLLILGVLAYISNSCYIWGTDSGECSKDTLDPLWRETFMPYCSKAVVYPACLPKSQKLPPSREFPNGRFFNHTVLKKDQYIQDQCKQFIFERIQLEKNTTLKKQNRNEYGDIGKIKRRFWKKPNCLAAYKNYFCWVNFPRCDMETGRSLPTCRSACENFFISCGYSKDLWRCGKSKYFNGYEPEPPIVDALGTVSYMRDYFPGQPFRQNKYSLHGGEYPICTPAIKGSANRHSWATVNFVKLSNDGEQYALKALIPKKLSLSADLTCDYVSISATLNPNKE
eukprot:gene10542-14164_t